MKLATTILAAAAMSAAFAEKISLDGVWQFRHEGGQWRQVRVPHDWSIESAPEKDSPTGKEWGFYKAGKGEYRRTFTLGADDLAKRLDLVFDGVLRNAEVRINGSEPFSGTRYGYTGFRVPLNGVVREGENEVAVSVDNSALPGSRWYMGSGIFRSVRLEKLAYPYIEPLSIDIRTALDGTVEIKGTLIDKDCVSRVSSKFKVDSPVLWSPETPKLYERDFYGEKIRFGIRTIEVSAEKGFLLNGKPVELHGACVHHDHGPLGAASEPEFEYRKAKQLKEAGFNAVRTSHNPVSESFLSACDELGLVVVDDMFDGRELKKTNGDYSTVFKNDWRADLDWIVRRDRVHPSVAMWSIGNEILERNEPSSAAVTKAMHAAIDRLDGTRPVTQALCLWGEYWPAQDAMAAELDVVGYNYLEHLTESDHERFPDRIIVYTETYPKDAAAAWRRIVKHPYVIGEFVWTGIDYLGESGIGRNFDISAERAGEHYDGKIAQFPYHGAYCGDIDLAGHRKAISHYRETLWNENAKTFIAVREPNSWRRTIATTLWSVWPAHDHWTFPGWEGKDIEVEVYTRKSRVKLFLNGKQVGEAGVGADTAWMAKFKIPYEPGELKAVADGEEAILRTAGEAAGIRYTSETIGRFTWVVAEVVDANGTVCPHEDREVTFTGNVIATCSGDLTDLVPATSAKRRTWRGRALAVVRD